MSYKIEFTAQGLDDISNLDKAVAQRVTKRLDWLCENFDLISPQPLKARLRGMYKLVIGDWRAIYSAEFSEKTITVHMVRHRSEVYK